MSGLSSARPRVPTKPLPRAARRPSTPALPRPPRPRQPLRNPRPARAIAPTVSTRKLANGRSSIPAVAPPIVCAIHQDSLAIIRTALSSPGSAREIRTQRGPSAQRQRRRHARATAAGCGINSTNVGCWTQGDAPTPPAVIVRRPTSAERAGLIALTRRVVSPLCCRSPIAVSPSPVQRPVVRPVQQQLTHPVLENAPGDGFSARGDCKTTRVSARARVRARKPTGSRNVT